MQNRLARAFSWLALGYAGRALAYLALTTVLAHALGPGQYGQVALFLAFAAAIALLGGSWPFLAVPVLGHKPERLVPTLRTAAAIALATTAVAAAVALPVAAVMASGEVGFLTLLALYSLGQASLYGLYSIWQTEGRMAAIATTQTAERVLALAAIGVAASFIGLHTRSTEVALTIATLAAAGCGTAWTVRRLRRLPNSGERLAFREVTHAVGPMGVVTAASYAVAWVDVLILAAFRSTSDVGVYALVYQIYSFVLQFGALWIVASLPSHARAAATKSDTVTAAPETVVSISRVWAGAVGALSLAVAIVLGAAFGENFGRGTGPLLLLLAGAASLVPYYAAVPRLLATGEARFLALVSVGGAALNLLLDIALVPAIGIWGPAIATTAQSLVVTVALTVKTRGTSLALPILAGAVPVCSAVAALAAGPSSPVLLVVTAAVVAASTLKGIHGLQRGRRKFGARAATRPQVR